MGRWGWAKWLGKKLVSDWSTRFCWRAAYVSALKPGQRVNAAARFSRWIAEERVQWVGRRPTCRSHRRWELPGKVKVVPAVPPPVRLHVGPIADGNCLAGSGDVREGITRATSVGAIASSSSVVVVVMVGDTRAIDNWAPSSSLTS